MSSAPNAGARWTSPVPSSVVTNDPGITTWESGIFIKPNGAWYLAPTNACPLNLAAARHHVGRLRMHRHRGVGDQCPRRGRPDEQVGALELARRPAPRSPWPISLRRQRAP